MLRAALAGSEHAREVLYDRHAPLLYRLAACLVGPRAAERVVVLVLVDAFTCAGAVTRPGDIRTQLLRLTLRRCRELPHR